MAELKNLIVTGKTRLIEHLSGFTASFSGNVSAPKFIGDLEGTASNATTATTASQLTTNSWGNGVKLWYLNAGKPALSTSNIGNGIRPVYLANGVITASSSNMGSSSKPVYMVNGVLTNCGANLAVNITGTAANATNATTATKLTANTWGGGTKLWYLNAGVPTNSSSNIGAANKPVYLSSGTITECGNSLAVNISGTAAYAQKMETYYTNKAGTYGTQYPLYAYWEDSSTCKLTVDNYTTKVDYAVSAGSAANATSATIATKLGSASVGNGKRLWYLNQGTPTNSSTNIASNIQLMYLSSGVLTASNKTVGAANMPVYLNAGNVTQCTSPLAVSITGSAASATTASKLGENDVGGIVKPIWLDNGVPTAFSTTVGAAARPVYMSGGNVTACTGNIGNSTRPVYMNNGTITICGNSLAVSVTGSANKATYDSAGSNIAAKWANYLPLAGGVMTGAITYSSYSKTGMIRNTVGSFDIQSTNASIDTKISLVQGGTNANYASMSYNDSEKCIEFLFS